MDLTFLAGHPAQGTADISQQLSGGVHHLTQRAGVLGWAALGLGSNNSHCKASASIGKLQCCFFCG